MGIRTALTRGSAAIVSLTERIAVMSSSSERSPTTWPPWSVLSSRIKPSWRQAGQHLFVVLAVARLVSVDEREVELLAERQRAQGLQARTDPELDPVGD